MSTMNEKELISFLKEQNSASLFFLYGADEYSKNICYNKIIKAFSDGCEPIIMDGQALDLQKLQEECFSVSFFSENKCICVRNPTLDSFSQSQVESLYTIISEKPESTLLIFIVKSQDINVKKMPKWAKFIDTINKSGIVVNCEIKSQSQVVSMIVSTAKKQGCTIDKALAADFADRCLNDMLLIENDLVKLCAFAAEKTDGVITADAIEHLSAKSLDFKTYEITRQLINKNIKNAIDILDSLFLQQVDAIAINSSLSASFLDIYRVKMMQCYNHSTQELHAAFDYKGKDYKIRSAGYDANKCSLEFIKNAILCLSNADVMLKSTKDNKKTLMEKTLIEIMLYDKIQR